MFRIHRTLVGAAAALAALVALQAEPPHVYGIKGVRIVTGTGQTLASGNLVIRDGIIEGVGPSAAIPDVAVVIDGSGLTVYPGLIDMGSGRAVDASLPPEPRDGDTREDVERWKLELILRPQVAAADHLALGPKNLPGHVAAGITTLLAIPPGEVILGQSALVNLVTPESDPQVSRLADDPLKRAVIKTPVALHVAFPERPRGRAYPQSLMGVIAFVRQSFLDARHYRIEQARAVAQPPVDPVLDAMSGAVSRRVPVAFEADTARDIVRALDMARELDLVPIITGGAEADQMIPELQAGSVPVLYSLDYPAQPESLAPNADEPPRLRRRGTYAPKVPAALASAGVTFAFSSSGLETGKQFLDNVALAVKQGLPADVALRALTWNAAKIAGVDSRLGSIEKGKIANLVVTDGDLFDGRTTVRRVFIAGREIPVPRSGGSDKTL